MYRFYPNGKIQQMIHQIKYRRNGIIAKQLGQRYGTLLRSSPLYSSVDIVIPVPLHKRRRRERGFNQSVFFAEGLASAMQIEYSPNAIKRIRPTSSQTRKSRLERLENMEKAFRIRRPEKLHDRHVLLVDDVLTTGATIESCVLELNKVAPRAISFATIALAEK
ncbi:MAG: phosphoribosyltransferase family protein [Saprospiraceae bacterium]|nr:phosphoribosyltransferase family protein [Saprospiraceae bacterium]